MPATVLLQIIVTGIVAIVPSASDRDVTRLIAPNHIEMTDDRPMVPNHIAFIEVHKKNCPACPVPDFSYHRSGDIDADERLVYTLNSQEVKLNPLPMNTMLSDSTTPPLDILKPSGAELLSTVYALKMVDICPTCLEVDDRYFSISSEDLNHHRLVAGRMDLRGGRKSVRPPNVGEVWQAPGTKIKQPFSQEVVFGFDVPATGEDLVLTDSTGLTKTISLQLFAGDKSIDVRFGNGPLISILNLDAKLSGQHRDDHFALLYDIFSCIPPKHPTLQLAPISNPPTSGPKDNCIPPTTPPSDPKPQP